VKFETSLLGSAPVLFLQKNGQNSPKSRNLTGLAASDRTDRSKDPISSQNPSIQNWMAGLVFACLLGTALPLTLFFAIQDLAHQTRERWAQAHALAQSIANHSAVAIQSRDRSKLSATIADLSTTSSPRLVRIEHVDGAPLAEMGEVTALSDHAQVEFPTTYQQMRSFLTTGSVGTLVPVKLDGKPVGRVWVIQADDAILKRFVQSIGLVLGFMLLVTLLARAMLQRFQRALFGPISTLTQSMMTLAHSGDLPAPLPALAPRELNPLIGGYNSLLQAMREREREQDANRSALEAELTARTDDFLIARDRAEQASSAKSQFLESLSHEVRTPMTGLQVVAELLSAEALPPSARRYVDAIVKSGRSLLASIGDILDVARIEGSKSDPEICVVDVVELVDATITLLFDHARSKGLELVASAHPCAPKLVAVDAVRFGQVLAHLISNALRFTAAGHVLVRIEPDPDAQFWRLIVQDTGPGMSEDKLANLFKDSPKDQHIVTHPFEDTGLGLKNSKRLVEIMGGQIGAISKEGLGTRVHVRLPAITDETPVYASPPDLALRTVPARVSICVERPVEAWAIKRRFTAAHGIISTTIEEVPDLLICDLEHFAILPKGINPKKTVLIVNPADHSADALVHAGLAVASLQRPVRHADLDRLIGALQQEIGFESVQAKLETHPITVVYRGAKVLVVDSDDVNRHVAVEALARFEIRADVAMDGQAALSKVAQFPYDLVLVGRLDADMDGFELARAIRKREHDFGLPRLAIVGLSAQLAGPLSKAWAQSGMDGTLHRPFTWLNLGQVLKAHLPGRLATANMAMAETGLLDPYGAANQALEASEEALFDESVIVPFLRDLKTHRRDFVVRVVGLFNTQAPAALNELQLALDGDDLDGMLKIAHSLKAMSLNIGARVVARLAGSIEAAARAHHMPVQGDIDQTSGALHRTLDRLSELMEASFGLDDTQSVNLEAKQSLLEVMALAKLTPEEKIVREELEADLETGALSIVYQPLFDRSGNHVVSAEALLRWNRGERTRIGPDVFIPIAEKSGFIVHIGHYVRQSVFADTQDWGNFPIALNVSPLELMDENFVGDLKDLFSETGYDPTRVVLEVTETAFLGEPERVRALFSAIKAMGCKLALDDFGVGYSSLTTLHRFAFDKIKIDREFVTSLDMDAKSSLEALAIIQAVSSIGRAIGREVIAEGVETETQHAYLKTAGVHSLQGYLFGKPVPASEFERLYLNQPISRKALAS
jgi:EAL domain-containing protein (putative c-di-GMP-specific phosphodiesterase class I)/signal transduction histidine kinase/DNA-binding NarL/FixJ family response regulator/HPt (histidine-containing phosphotransfer) domain-containing protein